jgi:DNA-3-methyladenine glycosylase II
MIMQAKAAGAAPISFRLHDSSGPVPPEQQGPAKPVSITLKADILFKAIKTMPATTTTSPPDWRQILSQDPVLAGLIRDKPDIIPEPHEDIYVSLLSSIISQQLSTKVARVIRDRFLHLFPAQYPAPELVLAQPQEALRGVGLSFQKIGYLRNVAAFSREGQLDYPVISGLADEDLIRHLIQIKGVGRWTAEMILMFTLGRPDVFPVDDLGIQHAMKKLYPLPQTGKALLSEMSRVAEAWRPYRTLASRYLWQSLDNAPA